MTSKRPNLVGIWVVEQRGVKDWHPTSGAALTKNGAAKILEEWRASNPDDEFRISKYFRLDSERMAILDGWDGGLI